MEEKLFYKPVEISRRWGCSVNVVLDMIENGELPAMPVGTRWRVSRAALLAHEAQAAAKEKQQVEVAA